MSAAPAFTLREAGRFIDRSRSKRCNEASAAGIVELPDSGVSQLKRSRVRLTPWRVRTDGAIGLEVPLSPTAVLCSGSFLFGFQAISEQKASPVSVCILFYFVCLIHSLIPPSPAAPSAPPQEVHLVSLSSTSLKVSWVAPPAASRHGAIVRYTVSYQALSGEDTERQEVADIGADASSFVLEGLEKWTEYQVWVRAHTDVGPGPESAPVKMRTKEDGRSSTPGRPRLSLSFPGVGADCFRLCASSTVSEWRTSLLRLSSAVLVCPGRLS